MNDAITFSRYKLTTFLACQRRFQLRYVRDLPWPAEPVTEAWREASRRGRAFHRMLHRHFLDLPVAEPAGDDPALQRWWRIFREEAPSLPAGERRPEETLTVPIDGHRLSGRFDLLILSGDRAHIFDWKTEARPRSATALRDDWQTVLYLALLVEGSRALRPGGPPLNPEKVDLTYWFVQAPQAAVTIPYGHDAHAENWQRLTDLVRLIDHRLSEEGVWPLTDDWEECGRCAYQVFCGRQGAPPADRPSWQEEASWEEEGAAGDSALEPELP